MPPQRLGQTAAALAADGVVEVLDQVVLCSSDWARRSRAGVRSQLEVGIEVGGVLGPLRVDFVSSCFARPDQLFRVEAAGSDAP